jgi:hypothetical protein
MAAVETRSNQFVALAVILVALLALASWVIGFPWHYWP